jgi:hypothetical protein
LRPGISQVENRKTPVSKTNSAIRAGGIILQPPARAKGEQRRSAPVGAAVRHRVGESVERPRRNTPATDADQTPNPAHSLSMEKQNQTPTPRRRVLNMPTEKRFFNPRMQP